MLRLRSARLWRKLTLDTTDCLPKLGNFYDKFAKLACRLRKARGHLCV